MTNGEITKQEFSESLINDLVFNSPKDLWWVKRNNISTFQYTSVCYGNGLFVAVSKTGIGNRVVTSPDGINWTVRSTPADNNWSSVCYNNGLFVAVATSGTGNRVMTSPDGINWTIGSTPADNYWTSVCYGNGLFVAVSKTGTGNRVMTSPDGINWTVQTTPVDNNWLYVCYGDGLFVAVAGSGTGNRVMTSPDGINWTIRSTPVNNNWSSVCYGNGLFVAVSVSGINNRVMTSPDGINWTVQTTPADNIWISVCYGNGLFIAVANNNTGDKIMTSSDGINWNSLFLDSSLISICYGNDMFVAVSYSGIIYTSYDSSTIILRQLAIQNSVQKPDIFSCGNVLAYDYLGNAIESGKKAQYLYSAKNTWFNLQLSSNYWTSICYGNGLFVAVANSGINNRVMTSSDGITWNIQSTPLNDYWSSICYGNGLFVAVANNGTGSKVMTSSDGINWTVRDSAANNSWNSICYGNGMFVAVSNSGTGNRVMTSPDGITWTLENTPADNSWTSICYGNGMFVAVSNSGIGNRVMTSLDGITWTIGITPADNNWTSVCYGNGLFVAVSNSGTGNRVMTSPDGINWTIGTTPADNNWNSICYGNGMFVAVSNSATGNRVMTSPDGITWTLENTVLDNTIFNLTTVCHGNGMFAALSSIGGKFLGLYDSGVDTSPALISDSDMTIPSVKAVKQFIENSLNNITIDSPIDGNLVAMDSLGKLVNSTFKPSDFIASDSPTFTGIPAAPTATAGTNTTQLATTAFVYSAVANLINSAPVTLNTLNKLAISIGNDANFANTMTTSLGLKAPLASPTFTGTVTAPVFTSSIATGNAPFTITSTTLNTNLNADLLDGLHSSSFATAAQGTKADNALPSASYTAADILTKLKTVDGSGSGLDADLLDGQEGSYYAPKASPTFTGTVTAPVFASSISSGAPLTVISNTKVTNLNADLLDGYEASAFATSAQGIKADAALPSASYTAADILTKIKTVDGSGSGIDADLLDGQEGSYYASLNSPTFTGTPAAPTAVAGTNTTQIATTSFVSTAIANLLSSAPTALDTLNELAAALGDDPNFATTMTNTLALKAPLASPAFTGTPTAPTAAVATNTTQIATTAFVKSVTAAITTIANLSAGSIGTIPYQSAANTTAMLAAGTSGQVLISGGAAAPSWKTLDLTYLPDSTFKKSVRVATTTDLGASVRTTTTLTGYGPSQSLACTTTSGSTTVTTTSTAGLKVGAVINSGTVGLAAGTTVASIASATTFTVNNRANIITTAITGNGTTATATFAAQTYAPYAVGSTIAISGATPTTYNGSFVVTACTTTSVSWASTTTTTATVQGTIAFSIYSATSITTLFTQSISALTVDGVTLALNDRVLVKNQISIGGLDTAIVDNIDNGIYYLSTLGSSSVAWVLTRVADGDTASKIASALVAVDAGTTYGGYLFDNDFKTTDTLGTTAMNWNSIADNGKKLNYFAATTSAELATVISDETGSGALVFAASPALSGTPTAPTATANTNTTQLATTAFVLGQVGTATPTMNGTATVGTSYLYARQDHVHPIDTSRAPLASPTFTGIPAAPTATAGTNTTQLATTAFVSTAVANLISSAPTTLDTLNELAAALGDDPNFATTMTNTLALKAPLASPAFTGTPAAPTAAVNTNTTQLATTAFVLGQVGTATPLMNGTAAVGTSYLYARQDHVHASDVNKTPFVTLSATTAATAAWYRIATSAVNIGANSGLFKVDFSGTGVKGSTLFRAACHDGTVSGTNINQVGFTSSNLALGLTQVRVVYHTTATANYAYVEVYNPTALAITYTVDLIDTTGWSLVTPSTVGSIPTGYTSESITLDTGVVSGEDVTAIRQLVSKVATGTAPLSITSTTVVPNLNADLLDGLHSSSFATAAQGTKADAALPSASYTAADILTKLKTVDGSGSGIDADLLDGQEGSYYAPKASPTFTGTVTAPVFTSSIATGNAPFTITSTTLNTNLNADLLDGLHAAAFATAAQGTKADNALPSASYTAADILTKIKTVDGSGSGIDADLLDGLHSSSLSRYGGEINFHGSNVAITTDQFIADLTALGAFCGHWTARGTWSYSGNAFIQSTVGNIPLAGSTVEVIGSVSNHTIIINSPTTGSTLTYTPALKQTFIYMNNGSTYSPEWRCISNKFAHGWYLGNYDGSSTYRTISYGDSTFVGDFIIISECSRGGSGIISPNIIVQVNGEGAGSSTIFSSGYFQLYADQYNTTGTSYVWTAVRLV